ncbi:CsgG/HfaB family protein [Deinococcus sp.]|uniref:CsgG/HfaB family protein n=1 Tax=Deinococcus sp. TaxID=47478 RepID=UPI003CC588F2
MKRTLLTLLLLAPSPLAAAQTTPAAPPTAPLQVSIAVGTFACKTNACTYQLGSATADALTTALLDTGKFSILERENVAQLTEENFFSASNTSGTPTQDFQGADVLVFGSITNIADGSSGGGLCLFGVCLGSQESTVGVDLRIVDARTRRILAGTHIDGKSTSNASSLNIAGLSLNNKQSSGVQSALSDMLKKAVDVLIQRIPASYYR